MSQNKNSTPMNFYRRKLLNTILYFVKARGRKPTTLTLLAKLLFYFDFEHFKETGYPALGLKYYAFPWGPLPLDFWSEVTDARVPIDFRGKVKLTESKDDFNPRYRSVRISALSKPDMDVFSPFEVEVLDRLAFTFKNAKVNDIVLSSHEQGTPWDKTINEKGQKAEIDYLSALDSKSTISFEIAKDSLNEFFAVLNNFQLKPTN